MTTSLIVTLLSQRPTSELEAARDKLRADIERGSIELEQIEEALARQSRRTSRPQRSSGQPLSLPDRVVSVLAEQTGAISPAGVIAVLRERGFDPKRGAVHTTLARLVKSGRVVRLGEGEYQLASRNGSSGESNAGPTENGATGPLSTAAEFQEAANE